jgi:RNA polymerase sigma-70 factor, ECF subfamily
VVTNDPHDDDLVRACVGGDARAWRTFLDRYARWILYLIHHALKRSRTPSGSTEAEDLLQDVLAYLVQNDFRELRKFPPQMPLKAWLRVVIAGRCWNYLRKKRPILLQDLAPAAASRPDPAPSDVPSEAMDAALQKLPWRDRLVLTLFYYSDRSYDEIARATGLPPAQVGVVLARAREKLKEILGPML